MSVRHQWAAVRELWQRYANAFAYHWQHRAQLRTDFFNKQEAEFLPAALSLQESPVSSSLRWTARALMGLVVFALAWSVLGHVDIVVNAAGKVIPAERTKTIASVDTASVRALHVTEGQSVRAGDLLIELDSSGSDAEHDKAQDLLEQSLLQIARSQALLQSIRTGQAPVLKEVAAVGTEAWQAARSQLDGQYQDYRTKLARIEGEIARHAEALPLAERRASDFSVLWHDGAVSYHAWLEREQARVDLQGQLADAKNQRAAFVAQSRKEAHDALTEARKVLAASEQDRRRAGVRSRLLKLTAPIDGTVQQLVVHTVGGVVAAAQPLMQIVPRDAQTEVEAFVENKDVGFVHAGQSAQVKVDAFDYTRFGTVAAKVSHVSHDAIQDEKLGLLFAARVALDQPSLVIDGRPTPLVAGMSVNVEIKTGTRRVIEYVLSPLMQHQREALHER